MNFLAAVVAQLAQWLLTKLFDLGKAFVDKMLRRKKIEDQANDSVEPLKEAKTGAEVDKATDSALDHF